MIKLTLGLTAIFLMICFLGRAQESKNDSTGLSSDSVRLRNGKIVNVQDYVNRFDPRKALFFSAILPGAGQAYNKKYWKIPLVYGGLIGLVEVVKFYGDGEVKYKAQLFQLINDPSKQYSSGGYQIDQLRTIVNTARRQRDYFTAITAIFYLLQMVDAHVDAHLKEFDVNPKFHVRFEPSFNPVYGIGLGLSLRF